jgi:hypothetical protein
LPLAEMSELQLHKIYRQWVHRKGENSPVSHIVVVGSWSEYSYLAVDGEAKHVELHGYRHSVPRRRMDFLINAKDEMDA